MKLLLAIFLIIFIAVSGSRWSFFNRKIYLGFKNIILTGVEYILVGILLGKAGLNILDSDTVLNLQPFVVFGLGWIGFLLGLQFRLQNMKKLPKHYFSITFIQTLLTFVIISFSCYWAIHWLLDLPFMTEVLIALMLGCLGSNTAQSALAIVNKNYKFKNPRLMQLIRYISGVDGLFTIIMFALILLVMQSGSKGGIHLLIILQKLSVSLAIVLVSALILVLLSRTRFSQHEFVVFLIGVMLFAGGVSFKNQFSPLFTGLLVGIIFANLSRYQERAMSIVIHSEKSIYIIMLLLLGASWKLGFDRTLLIAFLYIISRILAKIFSVFVATRVFKHGFHIPPFLGLALISEGGLAIAMVINFMLIFPDIANALITIILISSILNELFSPRLILSQFKEKEILTREKRSGKFFQIKEEG